MNNHHSQSDNDEPSLEFDIDAILASNPNPLEQTNDPNALPAVAPALPQQAPPPAPAAPIVVPQTPAYPDLITADIFDDQHTISTLGRDQSLVTRDDPPIMMFRPSFDPDRFADEEAPSLPKYSYKQTLNNTSGEAMRTLSPNGSRRGGAAESLHSGGSASNRSVSYRDLYIVVVIMALLLLAIITGLAIWLIALKTNQTLDAGGSISEESSVWTQPSLSPTRVPTRFDNVLTKQPTTEPMTAAPTKEYQTFPPTTPKPSRPPTPEPTNPPKTTPSPTITTTASTDAPTTRPTLAPTVLQTQPPTPFPTPESSLVQEARTKFLQVLETQSSAVTTFLARRESPQYHALDWLIHDPNFESYSNARLIQRWVLASFAFGLTDADWRDTATARSGGSRPQLPQSLMHSWVEYETHECDWFYTKVDNTILCNEDTGLYHRIDLRSQNLSGTIPTEIALLSNHLAFIYLYDNEIHGTIPSELALLTRLERLELTRNHLTGSIPSQVGTLSQLVFLGLGVNDLDGPLPTEMGNLVRLRTVGLERNRISGTIPTEFGNMVEARLLNLDRNELSGTVPSSLWRMTLLRGLNLSFNNNLMGTIPHPLCEQRLAYLQADCDNVECFCCSTCTGQHF